MIEGSRNEKVMILLASYVIGFTTAYIAYGINSNLLPEPAFPVNLNTQSATVALATKPASNVIYELTDKGLEVIVDGNRQLVSVPASSLSEQERAEMGDQGVYETVAGVSLSSSGEYLYYCEYPVGAISCNPFVYKIATQVAYPVEVFGVIDPVIDDQLRFDGDMLVSDEFVSVNPITPWQLVEVSYTTDTEVYDDESFFLVD